MSPPLPVLLLGLAAVSAAAQPLQPRAAIAIRVESVVPRRITAGTPTEVTIAARIPAGPAVRGVTLLRLNQAGAPLSRVAMRDDGQNGDAARADRVYAARVTLNEPRAGTVRFQVELEARPPATAVAAPSAITRSVVFEVVVDQPAPAPTVTLLALDPPSIEAGTATEVTISVAVTGAVPRSVELVRVDPGSDGQVVNRFERDGTRYLVRRRFQEPRPGTVVLRARAVFGGAAAAAQPVTSAPFTLRVVPRPTPPAAPTVSSGGLTVSVPAEWHVQQATLAAGGPIALRNSAAQLPQGGVLPPGVCEIEATSTALSGRSVRDVATRELEPRTIETVQVAGRPAVRVSYQDEFAPNLTYEGVAVYIEGRNRLHKIFLAHRAGDRAAARCLDAFNRVVASSRVE
jgi:hypothetical protein